MNKNPLTYTIISLLFAGMLLAAGCSGRKQQAPAANNVFHEAVYISGDSLSPTAMHVAVVNPWDSTAHLADYLLTNPGDTTNTDIVAKQLAAAGLKGTPVHLQLPLKRLIVYSAVHAALLCELGYADAIVGVADASYIKTPEIVTRIADGRITDIGSSMEPSLEKVIALKPDAILISPFQNTGHGVIDKTGIPVIECADYMERTPLGRAEWSRFYASLVQGLSTKNAETFRQSSRQYNELTAKVANAAEHPRVITELPDKGTWLVPGGGSYAARLLTDAGAVYPFSDNHSPGSVPMTYEKVFRAAQDADFWLVKNFGPDYTLADLASSAPFNKEFWAYKNGGVYFVDTSTANLFEETPFHPERLLTDYVAIFHRTGAPLRYYRQLQPAPAR